MSGADRPTSREEDSRARIVAAARRCFARDGAAKTRMAAVASEAGMARQTLYTFVESRAQLLELAMAARIEELSPLVPERARMSGDLRDDLAEVLSVMVEVTWEDGEVLELASGMTPERAMDFLTAPDSGAHPPAREALRPLYERSEREGALRDGVTLDEMAWWARNVLAPLTARRTPPDELREAMRRFAVPAFLADDKS